MARAGKWHRASEVAALAFVGILAVIWVQNSTWETVNGKSYWGVELGLRDYSSSEPTFYPVSAKRDHGLLYVEGIQQGKPVTRIIAPHWLFLTAIIAGTCWIGMNARRPGQSGAG